MRPPGPARWSIGRRSRGRRGEALGTELVTGPSDVSVGGRSAKHVVLTVREDVGCDPGYFYTWKDIFGGALWPKTNVGYTIRVWIVDVDGTLLFIAGETNTDAGSGLEQEIQQIVDSIRFDRTRAPSLPEVASVIDLNTGVMTPLPKAIVRLLGETAEDEGAESHFAASPTDPSSPTSEPARKGALRSSSPASTAPRSARLAGNRP